MVVGKGESSIFIFCRWLLEKSGETCMASDNYLLWPKCFTQCTWVYGNGDETKVVGENLFVVLDVYTGRFSCGGAPGLYLWWCLRLY